MTERLLELFDPLVDALDDLPVASIIAVLGTLGALYSLIKGDLTYEEFALAVGAWNAGTGILGVARSNAGKGQRSRMSRRVRRNVG